MFDFSWGHMIVIAIVALVVIGPKELPAVLRTAGQWMGKVRRMAAEFQGQFQEALREAEMADLKQHFDDISTAARDIPHFDPIATVRKEIQGATSFSSIPATPGQAASDAPVTGPVSEAAGPQAAVLPEPAAAEAAAPSAAEAPGAPRPEAAGEVAATGEGLPK